ncbi:hypothetical protein BLA29_008341, partial [Euroglyphus maynei]
MGGHCSIIPNQEPEYQLIMMPENRRGRRRSSQSEFSSIEKSIQPPPPPPLPIYGYSGYPIIQGYPATPNSLIPPTTGYVNNPYCNPFQTPGLYPGYPGYMPPPPPQIYQQTSKTFCSPELYESMMRMLATEMKTKQKYQPEMSLNDQITTGADKSQSDQRRSKSVSSKNRRRRRGIDGKMRTTTTTTLSETFSQRKPNYHFDSENVRNQSSKQLAEKIQHLLNDRSKERSRRRQRRRSKMSSTSETKEIRKSKQKERSKIMEKISNEMDIKT